MDVAPQVICLSFNYAATVFSDEALSQEKANRTSDISIVTFKYIYPIKFVK